MMDDKMGINCRIEYYASEVPMPRFKRRILKEWITRVAYSRGFYVGDLCYRFCNDEEILRVNNEFLGHDYYTDVITFDDTQGQIVQGQVLISLDTVRSNAQLYHTTYMRELYRVMIHAVLHLCGQGDKTEEEEAEMHRLEDLSLKLLYSMLE
ncbi:MAG: rRNA maturation RNase YbeY [Porphyromonas sp.]|nr:rRNA maturation RNase YbeY [Porphyromonas sp.]